MTATAQHWVKWILALVLRACGILWWRERRCAKQIRILLFHRIQERHVDDGMTVSHAAFAGQMAYLARRYRPVSLDAVADMVAGREPLVPGAIAVTFDDGYRDNYTLARPLLILHRIPATIFVTTGAVDGTTPQWSQELREAVNTCDRGALDLREVGWENWPLETNAERAACFETVRDRLKRMPEQQRQAVASGIFGALGWQRDALGPTSELRGLMMTWEMVRALPKEGITIGAHTVSHSILTNIEEQEAVREIIESKRRIETQLGEPVRHFAYPNGTRHDWSPAISNFVRRAGFETACTTVPGNNGLYADPYELRRIEIQDGGCLTPFGNFSSTLFVAELAGVFSLLRHLKNHDGED